MKLSNVFAKLTPSNKAMGLLGGLAVAAAAVTLAVPAAGAQQFGIGVQIGGPRYAVPAPVYRAYRPAYVAPYAAPAYVAPAPAYWDHRRWEEQRAHDEWVRQHEFYGHPYRNY